MPALPTIAVLGAPGTGATDLALALQQRITAYVAEIFCANTPGDCAPATFTLLMGLDLPLPAEQRQTCEMADARLRAALAHAGRAYQVVYGQGERRIENALNAIKNIAASAYPPSAEGIFDQKFTSEAVPLRDWHCEKCSDPDCERRLFSSLVDLREPHRA